MTPSAPYHELDEKKIRPHTPVLYAHDVGVIDTGQATIAFRVPSAAAKRRLAEIADDHDQTLSDFIRTAIAERVNRLEDEWVPTGVPAVDRKMTP